MSPDLEEATRPLVAVPGGRLPCEPRVDRLHLLPFDGDIVAGPDGLWSRKRGFGV
jgi:hypothetical protein